MIKVTVVPPRGIIEQMRFENQLCKDVEELKQRDHDPFYDQTLEQLIEDCPEPLKSGLLKAAADNHHQ